MLISSALGVAGVANVAQAQSFPSKAIRIYTTAVGGASDLPARQIAREMQASLGQPAVVENRALIGVEIVAQAPPDGHTLLHYTSPLWITPLFRSDVPWDMARDFASIGMTVVTVNVLVVHPSLPVKSVKDLIALAKARPGELNYGSTSVGSGNHLSGELFKSLAGVNIVRVTYKGAGAAINALIGGEVQVMFPTIGSVKPQIQSGKMRALATTSPKPSALAPALPTMAASGLPGYESISYTGMFAPAKTPSPIINLLNQEIVRTLRLPQVKERLLSAGTEVVASTPAEAASIIKAETERVRKLVQELGLREQ